MKKVSRLIVIFVIALLVVSPIIRVQAGRPKALEFDTYKKISKSD